MKEAYSNNFFALKKTTTLQETQKYLLQKYLKAHYTWHLEPSFGYIAVIFTKLKIHRQQVPTL